jgi:hypothetical protein
MKAYKPLILKEYKSGDTWKTKSGKLGAKYGDEIRYYEPKEKKLAQQYAQSGEEKIVTKQEPKKQVSKEKPKSSDNKQDSKKSIVDTKPKTDKKSDIKYWKTKNGIVAKSSSGLYSGEYKKDNKNMKFFHNPKDAEHYSNTGEVKGKTDEPLFKTDNGFGAMHKGKTKYFKNEDDARNYLLSGKSKNEIEKKLKPWKKGMVQFDKEKNKYGAMYKNLYWFSGDEKGKTIAKAYAKGGIMEVLKAGEQYRDSHPNWFQKFSQNLKDLMGK